MKEPKVEDYEKACCRLANMILAICAFVIFSEAGTPLYIALPAWAAATAIVALYGYRSELKGLHAQVHPRKPIGSRATGAVSARPAAYHAEMRPVPRKLQRW